RRNDFFEGRGRGARYGGGGTSKRQSGGAGSRVTGGLGTESVTVVCRDKYSIGEGIALGARWRARSELCGGWDCLLQFRRIFGVPGETGRRRGPRSAHRENL